MNGKIFADTNIIVYAHTSSEPEKYHKIIGILDNSSLVISTQVLREFINVMVRKFDLPIKEIKSQIDEIADISIIINEDPELIYNAIEINHVYKYRFHDCLIIAAALKAGCNTLLSEDMRHGQIINETLTIVNPFTDTLSLKHFP